MVHPGHVSSVVHYNLTLWPAIFGKRELGTLKTHGAALVLHLNKLARFFVLVKTLTECLNIHAFPHFPA